MSRELVVGDVVRLNARCAFGGISMDGYAGIVTKVDRIPSGDFLTVQILDAPDFIPEGWMRCAPEELDLASALLPVSRDRCSVERWLDE